MSINFLTLNALSVLLVSFGVCALLIVTQRWHGALSLDHDLNSVQKLHQRPVPRIGGIGVIGGLLAGVLVDQRVDGGAWLSVATLLFCAAPIFAAGLAEDLTKRVSVRARLVASFASAGLAAWLMDATLLKLDTPVLDDLMSWAPAAVLFSCFAIGGLTNAINIIDGLNGLASGAVALMLAGLAGIAWQAGDIMVFRLCLWGIAAMVGFMLLNYPFGRIFFGDGGAYLAGFWLASCAVLLLHRNLQVSTWAVLLCVIYPAWETVFSIYRRLFVQKTRSGSPDSVHFHHLTLRTIEHKLGRKSTHWQRHGLASAFVWGIVVICQIGAQLSYASHGMAAAMTGVFALIYIALYNLMDASAHDASIEGGLVGRI